MARPRKHVDTVEVLRLRLDGLSWRDIAVRMGLGVGTVFRYHQAALNALAAFQNRHTRYATNRPVPLGAASVEDRYEVNG